MPALSYGKTAYRRANGDLPEQKLVNLFVEASATDEDGSILLARAGLTEHSTPGADGPVRGLFSKAGLFAADLFSIVDDDLYRDETLIGVVTGTGHVSWATNGIDELLVNAGVDIHVYNGATLTAATFPDSADVIKVGFVSGLYLAIRKNTGIFYWSAVNDGTSWNGIDFATAESSADNLLDMIIIGDVVWFFGEESTEAWRLTGVSALPFSKVEQRSYQRGVHSTGCACELVGKLFWVGDDCRVYTDGLVSIADEGLAERIRASATVSCFTFTYEGHPIFAVRLDTGTWGFDVSTGSWMELSSWQRANWRAQVALTDGSTTYLGDDELNTIWTFDGTTDNGDVIEHVFTAILPILGGTLIVDNVGIHANAGRAESPADNPFIEMRTSRDEGNSWTDWRQKSLGRMGEYRKRIRWNGCGMFDPPGAIFEFRLTDTVPFRLSGVTVNEPGGGRGR